MVSNEKTKSESKSDVNIMLPIMISAVALPVSLFMWIGSMAWSFLISSPEASNSEDMVIPPTRWFTSIVTPLVVTLWGLKRKSLNRSGAALGLIIGFVLTLSNYAFLACLFTFFFTSSKATKFRSESKRKFEEDFKEGQRNWIQVLCNGGMAMQLGILYLIDAGCGERPIDFVKDYRASWLGVGILGVFSACNGDTWASELGSVIGSSEPVLITSGKRVPRGTNGGVTPWGIFLSFLGGLVVGISYYLSVLYAIDAATLAICPPQWPLLVFGGLAGFFGSLLDSVLGATLQFSGYDKEKGCVVERNRKGVKHISGIRLLDNHSINLVSSVALGLLTPKLAYALWP
ncbi:transmembrane protein 19 isoform X2 [Hetaerina americana]|uniref:transmembrane protein 19 isoform X2 n=1 Tax=Hetaerina americana TaxID=62018 RepID=UPI003A7F5DF1